MDQVIAAFPKRPFRIGWFHQTMAAKVLAAFGLLFLAGIYIADALYILPAVVDDIRYRDAPYVPGKLDDGKCQSKVLISICDLKVKYRPDGDEIVDKDLHMLFMFGDIDTDRPFVVHMPPGQPDHISTSWGQAGITNRVISQIVVFAIALALLIGGIRETRRRREDEAARVRIGERPQATFAIVTEAKLDKRSGITIVSYTWEPQGTPAQKKKARFPKGHQPFMLDDNRVLALTDGSDVTVLDSGLVNLDITPQERETIIKARSERAATA